MESLKELQKEKELLEKRILAIDTKIAHIKSKVLMYMCIKGKDTFVLHPINQKNNLMQNGWKEYSVEDMVRHMSRYELE